MDSGTNTAHAKRRGRFDAVAVHDGAAWRLIRLESSTADEIARIESASNRIPSEVVEKASEAQVRSIRFLLSGEMYRIEGAIPGNASLARANEQMRLAIAEASGTDAEGCLVAGMTFRWPGVRKPFTLAGRIDGDFAEDVNAALSEAGIACAGFASLEIAVLAVWRARMSSRASLACVGVSQSLVVAPARGANGGPQTAACGLRHFAADAENWLVRFMRTLGPVGKGDPLRLLTWGDGAALAARLASAGYSHVEVEDSAAWLADVAKAAAASRANRLANTPVPVANPYEPRKKFSSGWIAAAAAAILLLPSLYRVCCTVAVDARCRALAEERRVLEPCASEVRAAQKALASARAELSDEKASESARIAMRRPLVAFIDVSYFFCRHAGGSTVLDSIVQRGDRISAEGVFHDPEDGVRLNKAVLAYAKERGLEIVENVADAVADEESSGANRFRLVFDCSNVGGER